MAWEVRKTRSPAKLHPFFVAAGEQPSRGAVRHLKWNGGREKRNGNGVKQNGGQEERNGDNVGQNGDRVGHNGDRVEQNGDMVERNVAGQELTWADRVRGGRSAGGGGERGGEKGRGREGGGRSAVVCSGLPAGQKPEVSTGQWKLCSTSIGLSGGGGG